MPMLSSVTAKRTITSIFIFASMSNAFERWNEPMVKKGHPNKCLTRGR
jgi:hypothetical protein